MLGWSLKNNPNCVFILFRIRYQKIEAQAEKKKKDNPTKQQNLMKFGVAGWEGSDMENSYYQHKL